MNGELEGDLSMMPNIKMLTRDNNSRLGGEECHDNAQKSGKKATRLLLGMSCALVTCFTFLPRAGGAMAAEPWTQDAACQSNTMAAAGGALPANDDVFVLRYMGSANLELSYRGTVILFNSDFRRAPPARPLPVTPDQLTNVDAIYIGHGHGDHMMDAPMIAQQANAPMYGAWTTTEAGKALGLPDSLNRTVKNGDVQHYPGFTVEAVLAHHSVRGTDMQGAGEAWDALEKATGIAPDEAEQARILEQHFLHSSRSPRVLDEGTIGYLVTFENGYNLFIVDSAGPITDEERAMMQRLGGKVDVASVAYQGFYVPERQIEPTLPLVELFNPDIFVPNHHDQTSGWFPDIATYPLFMAIAAKLPATRSISPTYGTPMCFNTAIKGGNGVFVGESWTWPSSKASGN